MRGIISSLNMFMLDYLIVPVWAVFSIMGNKNAGKIMIPVTIVFLLLNYFNTRNVTKLFLLDINLAAACIAGIILNSFLYIRFVYADPQTVTDMVSLIFLFTFYIVGACVLCLLIRVLTHRRNMRIINEMAEGAYDDIDDDYEDDEDDGGRRSGLFSSITEVLKLRIEDDDEDEDEDYEEDDDDDGYAKPDGPKFKVVRK